MPVFVNKIFLYDNDNFTIIIPHLVSTGGRSSPVYPRENAVGQMLSKTLGSDVCFHIWTDYCNGYSESSASRISPPSMWKGQKGNLLLDICLQEITAWMKWTVWITSNSYYQDICARNCVRAVNINALTWINPSSWLLLFEILTQLTQLQRIITLNVSGNTLLHCSFHTSYFMLLCLHDWILSILQCELLLTL